MISVPLALHEATVCPRRISSVQSAMWLCFQRDVDTEAPARRPLRDRPSTAFVNPETRKATVQSFIPRLLIRKTFSQRGLQFRFPSHLVGYRIASCECASQAEVVDFATVGRLKFLVGIADETHREKEQGGLAGDHQPSCCRCRSPCGPSSRCTIVHGEFV